MDQLEPVSQDPNAGISAEVHRLAQFSRLMRVVFETASTPSPMPAAERGQVISLFIASKLRDMGLKLDPEINVELVSTVMHALKRSTIQDKRG